MAVMHGCEFGEECLCVVIRGLLVDTNGLMHGLLLLMMEPRGSDVG